MPFVPPILSDVTDSTSASNTNITGLSFPVAAGKMYWFRAMIPFTAAATTTGAEFGVDTPGSPTFLAVTTRIPTSATMGTDSEAVDNTATDDGSEPASDSATTAGNIAIVEGFCRPSAAGEIQFRMDTEVNSSAIVVKAGAFAEYRELG